MTAQTIVTQALERLDPRERARFLEEACRGNTALRNQVEALLSRGTMATMAEATTGAGPWPGLSEGPGSEIGPYMLLRKIGEGGMGTVYFARQSEPLRRDVAVKIVKPGMDSEQVIARFEGERQTLALMDHPNIARVFDAGTTPAGRPFFVMELVDGVSITEYCDTKRLTVQQRLELTIPVFQAIQHAHQRGIIHRDIKPSNILIVEQDGAPVPKVIDFGIAKAMSQRVQKGSQFTNLGTVVGTLEYMSPEQADLLAHDIDIRADIYSLGAVVYELLAGSTPLDRQRLGDVPYLTVLQLIREEEPARPSLRVKLSQEAGEIGARRRTDAPRLVRSIEGELDWIVMKALEKDRTRRYETASALMRDVQRHLAGEPVEAGPPSATYRLRKLAWKHRFALATAAGFAVLLIAGAAVSSWQAVRATRAEIAARADRDRARAAEMEARRERDRAVAAEGQARLDRQLALEQRQRADSEAATAKAVDEFLQNDLLAQAGASAQAESGSAADPDLKVRTAVDRAAARIEGKFDQQPQVEASIRTTVGNTYLDLGIFPEAEKQLKRALELRQSVAGAEHPDTVRSMGNLAAVYSSSGKYAEGERMGRQAVAAARKVFGPDDPETLASMGRLATVTFHQGKFAEAASLHESVVAGRRRVLGKEHPGTLSSMSELAIAYTNLGKYAQAESLYREAIAIQRRVIGVEHPSTLTTMSRLAIVYFNQGKYRPAEELHGEVLEIRKRVLGREHPFTLTSMNRLALAYFYQGKYGQAEALQKEVLDSRRKTLGSEHPDTLTGLNDLGNVYMSQGKLGEAEGLYRESVGLRRKVLGVNHPDTLISQNRLAHVFINQGRLRDAATLMDEVLDRRRRTLGGEHPQTLAAINDRAWVHLLEKQPGTAEALLRPALAIYREKLPNQWERYWCMSLLGASLARQGKRVEAEALLAEGYKGMAERRELMMVSSRGFVELGEGWLREARGRD